MPDRRHFITIQQGAQILYLATNRSKAHETLMDILIKQGIDPRSCTIRVSNLERTGTSRKLHYGALRDLLNGANPLVFEGVDVLHDKGVLYRLQRHHANGGE